MNKYKFSIVIPTRNSKLLLPRAISSIMTQTEQSVEIIIVDTSDDDSIESYIKNLNRENIKYVNESKRGIPVALNNGFGRASGEIFCWLNSDDYYLNSTALSSVFHFFSIHNVDFIYCDAVIVYDGKARVNKVWKTNKLTYQNRNNIFTGSLFFNSQVFKEFNFNENYKLAFEYDLIKFLFSNKVGLPMYQAVSVFDIQPNSLSNIYSNQLKVELGKIYKKSSITSRFINLCYRLMSFVERRFYEI